MSTRDTLITVLVITVLLVLSTIGILVTQVHEQSEIIKLQSEIIDTKENIILIKTEIIDMQLKLIALHRQKTVYISKEPIYTVTDSKIQSINSIEVGDFVKPTSDALKLINSDESTTRKLQESNFNEVISIDDNGVAKIKVVGQDTTEIINVYWLRSAGFIMCK